MKAHRFPTLRELGVLLFALLWSVFLLLLQGCFSEPPALGAPEADEGEGEGEAGESSSSSSSSSTTAVASGSATGDEEDTGDSSSSLGSSGDTSSSSSSSESSSSGEPPADYPPCSECAGQSCIGDSEGAGACAPDCGEACPDPGWGEPTCLNEVADGTQALVCFLDCTQSRACEAGMLCLETGFTAGGEPLWACMWGDA